MNDGLAALRWEARRRHAERRFWRGLRNATVIAACLWAGLTIAAIHLLSH